MHFLVYRWRAFHQLSVEDALFELGHQVDTFSYDIANPESCPSLEKHLVQCIQNARQEGKEYHAVFSINYFPTIAKAAHQVDTPYICWTCDSPMLTMYTKSVYLSTNYFFLFDRCCYEEWHQKGLPHLWYLPLGVDVHHVEHILQTDIALSDIWQDTEALHECAMDADISFVGSLYEKNRYDQMTGMPDYIRGYFDALMQVQMEIYGDNFLERMIPDSMEEQLLEGAVSISGDEFTGSARLLIANTTLGMKLAAMEREKTLHMLSQRFDTIFYSHSDVSKLLWVYEDETAQRPWRRCQNDISDRQAANNLSAGIHKKAVNGVVHRRKGMLCHRPGIDYETQMPFVFAKSRINLNITLRNIRSGIPLRIWDILGAGGFVLTNYQSELPSFFENEKHLVWYESQEDMIKKASYYLTHEEERRQIARQGHLLVKEKHTMQLRIAEMMNDFIDSTMTRIKQ